MSQREEERLLCVSPTHLGCIKLHQELSRKGAASKCFFAILPHECVVVIIASVYLCQLEGLGGHGT